MPVLGSAIVGFRDNEVIMKISQSKFCCTLSFVEPNRMPCQPRFYWSCLNVMKGLHTLRHTQTHAYTDTHMTPTDNFLNVL